MILGIDPGATGALAFIGLDGMLAIEDMPARVLQTTKGRKRTVIDAAALALIIRDRAPTRAFVESVHAMPGEGAVGAFSFGRGLGVIEGVLAAHEIPVTLIAPVRWKRALQVPAGKDGARLRASQLLPAGAGLWRLAKHDGRAEAALIGFWGVMHGGGHG